MILLTGGTGFLGSYILYYLLKGGRKVRAIKRGTSNIEQCRAIFGFMKILEGEDAYQGSPEDAEWFEADLLDVILLDEAFDGIDEVIHAAAEVSFDPLRKKALAEFNVRGTANIVNLAIEHHVKKFGYVSSTAAIHRVENKTSDENTRVDEYKFSSAYSESKYFAEVEVWRGVAEGLPAVMINPGIILGPGDFTKGSPKLISTVKKAGSFFPAGANGFVDVRDVAKGLIHLMDKEFWGERFISVSENLTYEKLFSLISEVTGYPAPKRKITTPISRFLLFSEKLKSFIPGKKQNYTYDMANTTQKKFYFSNNKIITMAGYEFMDIETTVKDTCTIYNSLKQK